MTTPDSVISSAPVKKGVLLLNLGTPLSPSVKDVRAYLNEFLNDPYVIDLPYVFRKLLVNGIILNTRPKNSAEAYQKIWAEDGSPLMRYTKAITQKVRAKMSEGEANPPSVKMAMRYGSPSLPQVLDEYRAEGITDLVFLPLYPQYSYAASESSIAAFQKEQKKRLPHVRIEIVEDFFSEPAFIAALAASLQDSLARVKPDRLLLSYHGIPERQIAKISKPPTDCCHPGCCDEWKPKNQKCYRAQCYETSRLLARALGLAPEKVVTSFQSRLGRTKWIEPYTDILLQEFPKQGIKRLLVASPSFTADCLETLEEIKLRYHELFIDSGGESFEYAPCLNDRDDFADFIVERVSRRQA